MSVFPFIILLLILCLSPSPSPKTGEAEREGEKLLLRRESDRESEWMIEEEGSKEERDMIIEEEECEGERESKQAAWMAFRQSNIFGGVRFRGGQLTHKFMRTKRKHMRLIAQALHMVQPWLLFL